MQSGGERGIIASPIDLLNDQARLHDQLTRHYRRLPHVFLGSSMGGSLGTQSATLSVLHSLVPDLPVSLAHLQSWGNSDPLALAAKRADPLIHMLCRAPPVDLLHTVLHRDVAHDLLHEPCADDLLDQIVAWVDALP